MCDSVIGVYTGVTLVMTAIFFEANFALLKQA